MPACVGTARRTPLAIPADGGTPNEKLRSDPRWREWLWLLALRLCRGPGEESSCGGHLWEVGASTQPSPLGAPPGALRSPGVPGQQTRSWCLRHWSTNVKQPEQVMAQFLWGNQGAFSMFMAWLLQCCQQKTRNAQPQLDQARSTGSMQHTGWICCRVLNLASR